MRMRLVAGALTAVAVCAGPGLIARAAARTHRDPADASGPLDLRSVSVDQVRRSIRLEVHTTGEFPLGTLNRHPDTTKSMDRFVCLQIHHSGRRFTRQLCFGSGPKGEDDTLGYAVLAPNKSVRSWKGIKAKVVRPDKRSLVAKFRPGAADLRPYRYRWHFVSQWTGRRCPSPPRQPVAGKRQVKRDPCFDRSPNRHDARFHLRGVQPIGCKDTGPSPVFGGSTGQKRVALTFDDGPSSYTPKVLDVLKRKHAKATFFEIGNLVPGGASIARSVLKSGDELGNHSFRHERYPSGSSMAATSANIKSATGFTPCLFRPPDGVYNSRVVHDASGLGMTTVIWNVDPRDWSRPGEGAIYSRVVSATRPGSIVIMHDGGGDRSQTVAALPHIIRTLRGRGYRFVTVSRLLHQRTVWGEAR